MYVAPKPVYSISFSINSDFTDWQVAHAVCTNAIPNSFGIKFKMSTFFKKQSNFSVSIFDMLSLFYFQSNMGF